MVSQTVFIVFLIFALFNVPNNAEERQEVLDRRTRFRWIYFNAAKGTTKPKDCTSQAKKLLAQNGKFGIGYFPDQIAPKGTKVR